MAFKMTPGMKGNPSMNRIKNLGACGGPGQPPCEPRFEKEVKEERKSMLAQDKSNYNRAKSFVKAKQENKVQPVKEQPVKLKINLPKGYEFDNKFLEMNFYEAFSDLSGFKSQEELDAAVMKRLKAPVKPVEGPVKEGPVLEAPIKEGVESPVLEGSVKAPVKGK